MRPQDPKPEPYDVFDPPAQLPPLQDPNPRLTSVTDAENPPFARPSAPPVPGLHKTPNGWEA